MKRPTLAGGKDSMPIKNSPFVDAVKKKVGK